LYNRCYQEYGYLKIKAIMNTKETRNPNAFPTPMDTSYEYNKAGQTLGNQEGMTLRDYFAGKVIQGLSAMQDKGEYMNIEDALDYQAKYAYKMANAMLKYREKTEL
jgi:hypothetical protein